MHSLTKESIPPQSRGPYESSDLHCDNGEARCELKIKRAVSNRIPKRTPQARMEMGAVPPEYLRPR